jgi:hypothetical protein
MATSPDPIALAHAAASAIERLCCTLDDCAREVEERGGKRTARDMLAHDACVAASAIERLGDALPSKAARAELMEMIGGCVHGYVRPAWAIRVVRLATEVCNG